MPIRRITTTYPSCSLIQYVYVCMHVRIIPVPKKLLPRKAGDYRPISILPALSKVFERILKNQITFFLTVHKLLTLYKSGFQLGQSTMTALLNGIGDLIDNWDLGYS